MTDVEANDGVSRRGFLRATAGTAAVAAGASGVASAQEFTEEIVVGPGGDLVFEPGTDQPAYVEPGTTVTFTWDSDNHNVAPQNQPDDATWDGHTTIENAGFETEFTFDVEGTYEYICEPHAQQGMEGTIEVTTELPEGQNGGGGGGEPVEPHELGVQIQEHWVGVGAILMITVSLIFTFFVLKYGESPHTSGGNR